VTGSECPLWKARTDSLGSSHPGPLLVLCFVPGHVQLGREDQVAGPFPTIFTLTLAFLVPRTLESLACHSLGLPPPALLTWGGRTMMSLLVFG
jgi:hypothetical protein